MIKEKWYIRFLKKIGIIKEKEIDIEESNRLKKEMCHRAIRSNVCPHDCEICAWNTSAIGDKSEHCF